MLPSPAPVRGAGRPAANDALLRAAARPSVSVVVPTCGRPALLDRCLRALAAQRANPGPRGIASFELIVVDDRPSAATERAVARWARRAHPLAIRYIA